MSADSGAFGGAAAVAPGASATAVAEPTPAATDGKGGGAPGATGISDPGSISGAPASLAPDKGPFADPPVTSDPGGSTGGPVSTGGPTTPVPFGDDAWQLVKPTAGLVGVHAQAWDHVSIAPDGRTLTVYFWSGVDGCYGLSDVKVTHAGGALVVTVLTGGRPSAAGIPCIDLAAAYRAVVTLDQPLVRDGSVTP
jgi:hypothetical protein